MRSSKDKKGQPENESAFDGTYRMFTNLKQRMNRIDAEESERLGIVPTKTRKLIEQKSDGSFEYNDKTIIFDNPDAEYVKVFVAIFNHQDPVLGYAPYEKINRAIQMDGVEVIDNREEMMIRIRNRVRDIKRYIALPKTTPTREALIQIKKGKGIIFRNPDVR